LRSENKSQKLSGEPTTKVMGHTLFHFTWSSKVEREVKAVKKSWNATGSYILA